MLDNFTFYYIYFFISINLQNNHCVVARGHFRHKTDRYLWLNEGTSQQQNLYLAIQATSSYLSSMATRCWILQHPTELAKCKALETYIS